MLMRINIKIVLDMGKGAPKWTTLFSINVNSATTAITTTIIVTSRFRRLRSSSEIYDFGFLDLVLFIELRKDNCRVAVLSLVNKIYCVPIGFKVP